FLVQIELTLKKFIIPVMLLGMGLAFLTLTFTNSVTLVILSVCFVGFGQGSLFPIIVLKALDKVPTFQADRAVAITSSFTFLGQFLSPIVLDGIGKIADNPTIRFQYGVLAGSVMVIVLICMVFIVRSPKNISTSH